MDKDLHFKLDDLHFALDGRMLLSREEIISDIESVGYTVDSDVTAKTDYLVQSNTPGNRITRKLRKAIQNKVEIITEDQLYLLIQIK